MDNLTFTEIISKSKDDKNFALKYLNQLFNYYNDNLQLEIKCLYPLAAIKCFIPLPTRLLLSDKYKSNDLIVKISDSEYQFKGHDGYRIVFSDKILPFETPNNKMPIPFSFPLYNDSNVEIMLSNIYYWEVTIGENIIDSWDGECVSIGFGHKNTRFESHAGWYDDSFGFHSDDGTVRHNITWEMTKKRTETWLQGDIAGAGLIYMGKNRIKPFFTFNGKLIYLYDKVYLMTNPFFPIIGYNHSNSIKINFSSSPFKFNIKQMINEYSKTIIQTQNQFIKNYDLGEYLNFPPVPTQNINIQEDVQSWTIQEETWTNQNNIQSWTNPVIFTSTTGSNNASEVWEDVSDSEDSN
jgi:hypothetical protein